MNKKNTETWQKTLPEDWTITVTDENGVEQEISLRDHPALADYATKDEAVKALVHAQRMLGKTPEGYVRLPGANTPPEQADAFYTALGRPEEPEAYVLPEFDLPDGYEVQEQLINGFTKAAFDLGLTTVQVSGLYEWFLPVVLAAHDEMERETCRSRDCELESLRSVHRTDMPRVLDSALRAAEAIGGEELLTALDKTRAGDQAAVINAFARIAPLVLEGGLRGAAEGWGEDLSREKLREMMQDPRYHDPNKRDPEFVKKVRKGFETLYPGDYVPGSRL